MSMKKWVYVVGVFILLALTVKQARAETTSLTVSPAILESIVKPGEEVKVEVVVINQANATLPIKGYVRNFVPNEKEQTGDSSAFDASRWFTLDPADFILQPREEKKIGITLHAPEKVEPGGHYATVYFEPLLPESVVGPGSGVSLARVGVLVFLIAPGDIREELSVESVIFPTWQSQGPVEGKIKIKNSGNLHLMPTSRLTVTDMFGKNVAELSNIPEVILPGTAKEMTVTWDKKLLAGKFRIEGAYIYGAEKTAVSIGTHEFWIIPWHLVLLVFIPLTSITYFVIVGRKRIKKAWSVLTGKSDTWLSQESVKITLQVVPEEKQNAAPKQKVRKKSHRHTRSGRT